MCITLQSPDRVIFGVTVRQQENTFLSLTDLQNAYNRAALEYGWSEKRVDHFTNSQSGIEDIYELLLERGIIANVNISTFAKNMKNSPTKYLKQLGVWKTTRKNGVADVFVDPYIWVYIALWLNPKIKSKVVIWLTDSLIFNRLEAKAQYRPMTKAIQKYLEPITPKKERQYLYANEANLINELVFGKKGKGLRDVATAKQLRDVETLERFNTYLLQNGVIDPKIRRAKLLEFVKI